MSQQELVEPAMGRQPADPATGQQPADPVASDPVGTSAPSPPEGTRLAADAGPSEAQKVEAVKEVTGIGLAVIIAIILVVILVTVAGLRLLEKMLSGILDIIGPATACGLQISSKEQAYRDGGMTQCDAYIKAMNEVATAPNTPCPGPTGDPPASAGAYAQYLIDIGCTPPRPVARS